MYTRLVYARQVPVLGRLAYYTLKLLGVEIPCSVPVGRQFELAHGGFGVVVHSKTIIGDRVRLYPGVGIGRADIYRPADNRNSKGMVIEDDVILSPGAKVLCKQGILRVRRGTVVGANAVLLESTGEYELWAGVPARRVGVRETGCQSGRGGLRILCSIWYLKMASKLTRVCLVPRLEGIGGMVSFQRKIARGLQAGGIEVSTDLDDTPYQAVLVIGGTRNLDWLAESQAKWSADCAAPGRDELAASPAENGVRHYLRAEIGNWLLAYIRSHLAEFIVYQSQFSREWWERVRGPVPAANRVIYNGVDLRQYYPGEGQDPPVDRWRVLLVEGSLLGGYEAGLEVAVKLVEGLQGKIRLGQSTCPGNSSGG